MARKDRAAARRRHSIDRARRQAGDEPTPAPKPKPAPGAPSSRAKTNGGRPSGGRGRQTGPLRKLQVGDVDRRGREFKRNMVLHPRTAMFISLAVFALAIFGLIGAGRQWISYLSFAVGFLVWADSRTTWLQAGVGIAVAAVCFAYGALLFRYQVL